MRKRRALHRGTALILAAGLTIAGCRTAPKASPEIVQPGAPGQSSRVITAEQAANLQAIRHTDADVRFMQDMIGHHAQALEMTALVHSRTTNEALQALARRIEISQADEIKMMQEWLTRHGEKLPDPHAHHARGARLMPGMLTPEDMQRLSGARGAEFDRLFLQFMIRHHEGALTMVEELFDTAGAGQEPDVFAFASEVDADQAMEIDRMLVMLSMLSMPGSKELQT